MSIIMEGNELSKITQNALKVNIKSFMIRPSIALIQIGENQEPYISMLESVCSTVGIYFRLYRFDEGTPELSIINKIKELNNDDYVNGILINLPIPANYNEKRLINTIVNSKDVDGLTDINIGRFMNEKKSLIPCTAAAVLQLIEHYNIDITNKKVVVIGNNKLVTKTLVNTFLIKNNSVLYVDENSGDLDSFTLLGDIVIITKKLNNKLNDKMIKKDSIIIDASNYIDNIDYKSISKKASFVTKEVGGIGPVVISNLLENTLLCYNSKNSKK